MDNNSTNISIPEADPAKPLEESFAELDSLIGLKPFKKEMYQVLKMVTGSTLINPLVFPYHYIITIDKACGLTKIVSLMAQIFHSLGIINSGNVEEVQSERFFNPFYFNDGDYSGIVVLHEIDAILKFSEEALDNVHKNMVDSYGKKVFILVLPRKKKKTAERLYNSLRFRVNCRYLDLPSYTIKEYADIGEKLLKSYNLTVTPKAKEKLIQVIKKLKRDKNFSNIHTIETIIHDLRVNKFIKAYHSDTRMRYHALTAKSKKNNILDIEDIKVQIPTKEKNVKKLNSKKESSMLDLSNMVGMNNIKNKIEEIACTLSIQKKLKEQGLNTDAICFHMQFSGNPGTGKTTAARLIGKTFKDMGLLEKGDFFEVSRDDLIGQFMGHSSAKTKEIIEKAMGSVLFIDEAYSLVLDERDMYGQEILTLLVKEMENNRENIVIIFAGYTEDLNNMISKNPGLKHRIPHKIEFPDYTPKELTQIFTSMIGSEYTLAPGVKEKAFEIFKAAIENKDRDFGNGRFARNLVERLKMKQAKRLINVKSLTKEEMLTIQCEDMDRLLIDPEVILQLSPKVKEKKVGFC